MSHVCIFAFWKKWEKHKLRIVLLRRQLTYYTQRKNIWKWFSRRKASDGPNDGTTEGGRWSAETSRYADSDGPRDGNDPRDARTEQRNRDQEHGHSSRETGSGDCKCALLRSDPTLNNPPHSVSWNCEGTTCQWWKTQIWGALRVDHVAWSANSVLFVLLEEPFGLTWIIGFVGSQVVFDGTVSGVKRDWKGRRPRFQGLRSVDTETRSDGSVVVSFAERAQVRGVHLIVFRVTRKVHRVRRVFETAKWLVRGAQKLIFSWQNQAIRLTSQGHHSPTQLQMFFLLRLIIARETSGHDLKDVANSRSRNDVDVGARGAAGHESFVRTRRPLRLRCNLSFYLQRSLIWVSPRKLKWGRRIRKYFENQSLRSSFFQNLATVPLQPGWSYQFRNVKTRDLTSIYLPNWKQQQKLTRSKTLMLLSKRKDWTEESGESEGRREGATNSWCCWGRKNEKRAG